ncbi:DUF6318 family protein [Kribbella sp. NBC_00482]|uniref:DUF6318 family protein n=1 Tax=Kribbella sp. NBC_00482 TaxID=2975968 RepID=UPI002E1794FD
MTCRYRPTTAFLACLSTTALLAACGQGSPEAGHPNTAPPPATAADTSTGAAIQSASKPTPSTAPGEPPERPTGARGVTLAAADQFVRYYSDLLNYASATGDTSPMLAESEAGCENCKSYAKFVAQANAANGLLKGNYLEKVTDVPELYRGESGRLGGSATVAVGAYVSRQSKSATAVSVEATKYTREFALSPQDGNWVMYEMELKKQ